MTMPCNFFISSLFVDQKWQKPCNIDRRWQCHKTFLLSLSGATVTNKTLYNIKLTMSYNFTLCHFTKSNSDKEKSYVVLTTGDNVLICHFINSKSNIEKHYITMELNMTLSYNFLLCYFVRSNSDKEKCYTILIKVDTWQCHKLSSLSLCQEQQWQRKMLYNID